MKLQTIAWAAKREEVHTNSAQGWESFIEFLPSIYKELALIPSSADT